MSLPLQSASGPPLDHPGSALHNLNNIRLFSNFTQQEVAPFQMAAKSHSYTKGKMVYLQADPAKFFYVVGGGWIKLFRTMPEGQEVIIDMLTTGILSATMLSLNKSAMPAAPKSSRMFTC